MNFNVLGIDPGLNHCAVTKLSFAVEPSGPVIAGHLVWCVTERKKNVKLLAPGRSVKEFPKIDDPESSAGFLFKLAFWAEVYKGIFDACVSKSGVSLVGIEDFAYDANQGAHQLGAVGGIARATFRTVPVREIPISTVKVAAVGHGGASKEDVEGGLVAASLPELAAWASKLDAGVKNAVSRSDVFDSATIALICMWEIWARETGRPDVVPERIRRALIRVSNRQKVAPMSQELISPDALLKRSLKGAK